MAAQSLPSLPTPAGARTGESPLNDPRRNSLKLLAAFVAIYVVWGTTYLAIKYAVETIPPFLMMGMRSLSAGTVLYTWGRLRGNANVTPS